MVQAITGSLSFYETVNNKYSSIDKISIANKLFKSAVNIGEAVVNILGNTGIAGFKFNIPQTEQVRFESEITDFYTDVNTPVQDHIVRKPLIITCTGLVGDYFYSINEIEDMLSTVASSLTLIRQFLPEITSASKEAILKKYSEGTLKNVNFKINTNAENTTLNKITDVQNTKSVSDVMVLEKSGFKFNLNGMDLFKIFQNLYKLKSSQTIAFLFFEALWKSQYPFSVETTWKRFDNMVVQSIIPSRDNNADITEFQVTFKQIYTTETKSESVENVAGRMKEQAATTTQKGETKGQEVAA